MSRSILLYLSALFAVSCAEPEIPAEEPSIKLQEGLYTLPVLETTDIHGYIISTDNNGTVHYRMAYIADKVKDIRGHGQDYDKSRLLLLDGGDIYQGASVSNLLSGEPVYTSMGKMEYDAVALGNHEFDWGAEQMVDPDATLPDYSWDGKVCVNDVPVLCANLFKDGVRASFTKDYVIVEKTAVSSSGATIPVRIGIIGFAINYGSSIINTQFGEKGFSIKADYTIANDIATELESQGLCDATILLAHGAARDVASALGRSNAIDLVLGGHSHQTMTGRTEWGLPYIQGGRYCEHFASASLCFIVNSRGEFSFAGADHLAVMEIDPYKDQHNYAGHNADELDSDILEVSDRALAATEEQQKEVIGHINVDASTYYLSGSGGRAAVISNWMCDIIRRIGGADVSFVNAGGIRTSFPLNGQPSRDITVANVFEMFPFSNPTYIDSISYADLLKVLEYSMTSGGEGLFSRMTGVDCYFTETDYGSYTTRSVHSIRKDGTVIYQKGKWTGDWASRNLILAVSEYLAITERTDYYTGLPNPLIEWNRTEKLLSNDLVDNVSAVGVLREESAQSGGFLYIDTQPHYILYVE